MEEEEEEKKKEDKKKKKKKKNQEEISIASLYSYPYMNSLAALYNDIKNLKT